MGQGAGRFTPWGFASMEWSLNRSSHVLRSGDADTWPPLKPCALILLGLQQGASDMSTKQAQGSPWPLHGVVWEHLQRFLRKGRRTRMDMVTDICGGRASALPEADLALPMINAHKDNLGMFDTLAAVARQGRPHYYDGYSSCPSGSFP